MTRTPPWWPILLAVGATACAVPAPEGGRPDRPPRDTDTPAAQPDPSEPPDEEPDEDPDEEPGEEPSEEADDDEPPIDTPDPVDPTAPGALCFPGPDDADDVCVDVVPYAPATFGAAYAYPDSPDPRYSAPTRYIDLAWWDGDIPIARNFVLGELVSIEKGQWAVLQPRFVRSLQAVRDAVGGPVHVNSGYRNPSWNAGVGGVQFSRHQWGDAADIRADAVDLVALGEICEAAGAAYVGFYATHVHCDWRDDPLDPVLFGVPTGGAHHPDDDHDAVLVPAGPGGAWTAPATGWEEGEPLRVWEARDTDGDVIARGTGERFVPPDDAAEVEVRVGERVVLRAAP